MGPWENNKAIKSVLGYLTTFPFFVKTFVTEKKSLCITILYNLMTNYNNLCIILEN